jgi:5-(carboxyamino)imidazole ribonucleotide synthase
MTPPLLPGPAALARDGGSGGNGPRRATLGVVGGGQLGRMFVHAAQRLGFALVVLDPDPASPAGQAAEAQIVAAYDDAAAIGRLAAVCDAVTTEFENVPAATLAQLAMLRPVAPSAAAVAACQHRLREKARFLACDVACAPHASIDSEAALAAVDATLLPGILKTASLGYDGKGQAGVDDRAELDAAWRRFGRVPCVLEQRLALAAEFSVIVARAADGHVVHLPVQQNLHRDGILAVTEVPAPSIPAPAQAEAIEAARRIAEVLDYVGVLCVEFFLLDDGRVLANEMAPRPHNSGHYSIEACSVSQFELQVRALAGLPLPAPRQHSPALMLNLLGDLWFSGAGGAARTPPWAAVLALPGAHLHLYGKAEARPGRKMGHLTITAASASAARAVAAEAAALLGLPPP